jgi:hypothetical protein
VLSAVGVAVVPDELSASRAASATTHEQHVTISRVHDDAHFFAA